MPVPRKEVALDLYEQGFSSREAARLSGLSSSYVRSLARDSGIARRPGRPPSLMPDNFTTSKGAVVRPDAAPGKVER